MSILIKGMEMPCEEAEPLRIELYADGTVIVIKERPSPSRRMGDWAIWTYLQNRSSTSDFTMRILMVWLHDTM